MLPTRKIIVEKTDKGEISCVFCGEVDESTWHLFMECPFVRVLAFAIRWGLKLERLVEKVGGVGEIGALILFIIELLF